MGSYEEESHEEEGYESQQDRQGQACEGFGLPRNQSEDGERPGEIGYGEEQVRQNREQEGTQGARNQRLLPCRRQNRARESAVCQGEVAPRLIFGMLANVLHSDMLARFFIEIAVCASGPCTLR